MKNIDGDDEAEIMRCFTRALDDTTRWIEENGFKSKQAA